jgi:phage shock protein PspC (stress-responsive transcriptional regulator)
MVAGVLSGIADYFDVDVALVRLIGVATMILTVFFPFALFYICAWIILPQDTAVEPNYKIID